MYFKNYYENKRYTLLKKNNLSMKIFTFNLLSIITEKFARILIYIHLNFGPEVLFLPLPFWRNFSSLKLEKYIIKEYAFLNVNQFFLLQL